MTDGTLDPGKSKAELQAELATAQAQLAEQSRLMQQAASAPVAVPPPVMPGPPPGGAVGRAFDTVDHGVKQTQSFWSRYSGLILAGIGLILIALFILRNNDDISIDFLLFDWTGSLAVALLVAALLGGLIGWGLEHFRD